MTDLDKMLGEVEAAKYAEEFFAVSIPYMKDEIMKEDAKESLEKLRQARAAFDRVCAALREAVKQRNHWTGCAIMTQLEIDKTIERENQTIAQILGNKDEK